MSQPNDRPPQPPRPPQRPDCNRSALAALVFGIIGLLGGRCSLGLPYLLAVIVGHVDTRDGSKAGRAVAETGLILSPVVILPAVLISVLIIPVVRNSSR